MEKVIKPDIKGEMDEFQRASQDLRRKEKIDISVEELVRAFKGLKEQTLIDDVWLKLENTESNNIEVGDMNGVRKIAKKYKKTNPDELVGAIKSGEYERPLILKMGDRYILIAGNTRLCTAAAMGVNPKVFIGEIGEDINESELLKGGYADNKSLIQIAKKHDAKNYYHIDDMVKSLKKQVEIGLPIEMEHTDDKDKAREIVMDHLWENPSYYTKLKKSDVEKETKESMGAGSSGSFEGPVFSDVVLKKDIHKFHNSNLKEQQEEVGEATDASSSGGYDVPLFGKTPKGRRNPLKIDGPDSIYKGRAVTDKKFPKWGGPGGVFVKVKEKCKKFPYCNQGDTGALEFIKEDKEIVQAITETSKKYGIPYKEMEKIVLNEINKIFI
jgi:hypothetical protein